MLALESQLLFLLSFAILFIAELFPENKYLKYHSFMRQKKIRQKFTVL